MSARFFLQNSKLSVEQKYVYKGSNGRTQEGIGREKKEAEWPNLMLLPRIWGKACTLQAEWQEVFTTGVIKQMLGWIKRDQLDVTCFIISLFNAQHVSDVNTSILRSLRLICWVISWVVLLWYELRCGLAGLVWYRDAVLQPTSGYHTSPAKPQRNTKTHRTRAIQRMK